MYFAKLEHRTKVISKRWISIISMGIVTGAVWYLILWSTNFKLKQFLEIPKWASLSIAIVFIFVFHFLSYKPWTRKLAILGLKHPFTYPPHWLAIFPATFFFIGVAESMDRVWVDIGAHQEEEVILKGLVFLLIASVIVILSPIIRILLIEKMCGKSSGKRDGGEPSLGINDFESIKKWIMDDSPVTSFREDRFSFGAMAQRIAKRFAAGKGASSIAIIGSLGSGKTSLSYLVEEQLKGKRIKIVRVELWTYHTAHAAVEGILGTLIDALAEEVPVVALRGVSREYLAAMGEAGGYWAMLSKILQLGPSNPSEALNQIEEIAIAIGWKYVLWIEDLERYSGEVHNG